MAIGTRINPDHVALLRPVYTQYGSVGRRPCSGRTLHKDLRTQYPTQHHGLHTQGQTDIYAEQRAYTHRGIHKSNEQDAKNKRKANLRKAYMIVCFCIPPGIRGRPPIGLQNEWSAFHSFRVGCISFCLDKCFHNPRLRHWCSVLCCLGL